MAAEGVGLAASVAGLLSLGLQITSGIVKYLDAFESRQEELGYVRQQNDAVTATLLAIEKTSSSFQGQHPEFTAAVSQNIQSCEKELNAVEALHADLADCDRSNWTIRLENKKKKLTYAFHRPKIQQLAQRLQQANEVLQLTLTGLGLEISMLNTNKLDAIELSSQAHASELLLIRSKVAAIEAPIASVNTTANLVGVITNGFEQSTQAIRQDFQQSQDLMKLQLKEQQEALERLEKHLEKLHRQGERIQSKKALAARAASKPAALKELCDIVQAPKQSHSLGFTPDQNGSKGTVLSQNSQFTSTTSRICICHRLRRYTVGTGIQLGYIYLSNESETQGHWPSCPLSKTANKNRRVLSLKYTGLVRMLKSAIGISFECNFGAGGFGISPNFTYYPTVDEESDPAFRILSLMWYTIYFDKPWNIERFMLACLKKLVRLFDEKQAHPAAVNDQNQSLMHQAAWLVGSASMRNGNPGEMRLLHDLVRLLLSYGVPAFTYDTKGRSPLLEVCSYSWDKARDIIDILVQANIENRPAVLDSLSPPYRIDNMWPIDTVPVYSIFHGFAEACNCGPLSMAVLHNDLDEVAHILHRFPGSLAELNIYGQSPLHIAAAKPQILSLLVKAAGLSLLDRYDNAGVTVLETAVVLSSTQCTNGTKTVRCRQCACTECVEILLKVGCSVRMCGTSIFYTLGDFLGRASELARRRYIFHMKELRTLRLRRLSSHQCQPTSRSTDIMNTTWDNSKIEPIASGSPEEPRVSFENSETGEWDWIYREIDNLHLAELFYRHGFRPGTSFFARPPWNIRDHTYICWLVEHGADLFVGSLVGPPIIKDSSNTGLFVAYHVYYALGEYLPWQQSSEAFNELKAAVERRNLTDGCRCHCSKTGCSPFIWGMKGLMMSLGPKPDPYAAYMSMYYRLCGSELTMLTYGAAIRFATFQALGLTHTCCDPGRVIANWGREDKDMGWVERDDVDIINEEQASLLELHEELVAEFGEEASKYINNGSNNHPFSEFWSSYWNSRIKEVLEQLDGHTLTDAERRGAEEIGVRWCQPVELVERKQRNPYERDTLEYDLYWLDLICPEYNEPWPGELRRVTELP